MQPICRFSDEHPSLRGDIFQAKIPQLLTTTLRERKDI